MAYYDFLNVAFSFLLDMPAFYGVLILSAFVSLIVILITKYTTNQALMKQLKEDIKKYQDQLKQSRNDTAKAMEIQKKAMEVNMKYMSHSLRPTLITFIPIILIFGWMSSVFAFEPIKPMQEFLLTAHFSNGVYGNVTIYTPEGLKSVDGKTHEIINEVSTFKLKGQEGLYTVELNFNSEKHTKDILITNGKRYLDPVLKISKSQMTSIEVGNSKLIVMPIGYKTWFGWLGTYIIFSIIFTMLLRKFMKVY